MPFPENEAETNESSNYRAFADVIDYFEIYPGSKLKHLSSLHAKTGIPYNEMIFFDDEMRNKEVEKKLGIHFVYVPNGMTLELFISAVKEFSKKKSKFL
jgi:magnesium-dependent phosphatase 1